MPRTHRVRLRRAIRALMVTTTTAIVLELGAASLAGAPTVTIKASTRQARKGQPFHIYVCVESDEPLDRLEVRQLAVPTGFRVVPGSQRAEHFEGMFEADFDVTPPGQVWGNDGGSGGDTREEKWFSFDVAYIAKNGAAVSDHRIARLQVPLTINPVLYVVVGVIGLFVGVVIKTLTAKRETLRQRLEETKSGSVPATIWEVAFHAEWLGLLTTVALGVVALLYLAHNEIPTRGWAETFGLAVSLAFFADDQLLAKLR